MREFWREIGWHALPFCGPEDNDVPSEGSECVVACTVTFYDTPDYLPEPSFWAGALRAERVVLLAGGQYVKQSRHNRARLRGPELAHWLTIPVRRGQLGRSIRDTAIQLESDWWNHHRKALQYNYGSSPYFEHYFNDIVEVMNRRSARLADVTIPLILLMAKWLGVACVESGEGQSAPEGAGRGAFLIDGEAHFEAETNLAPYRQAFDGYMSDLSSLDILFNHGPRSRDMILAGSRLIASPAWKT